MLIEEINQRLARIEARVDYLLERLGLFPLRDRPPTDAPKEKSEAETLVQFCGGLDLSQLKKELRRRNENLRRRA